MTTRKVQLYKALFKKLKNLFPSLDPRFAMSDFEAAIRKAIIATFPDTRLLGCRFHVAKALHSKLKGKFRLGNFYRPKGSALQKKITNIFRQYFAIPLIRHQHMRGEVERLERELRQVAQEVRLPAVARRLNQFHNYFVQFWMRLNGSQTLSVFESPHKTNNLTERYVYNCCSKCQLTYVHNILF